MRRKNLIRGFGFALAFVVFTSTLGGAYAESGNDSGLAGDPSVGVVLNVDENTGQGGTTEDTEEVEETTEAESTTETEDTSTESTEVTTESTELTTEVTTEVEDETVESNEGLVVEDSKSDDSSKSEDCTESNQNNLIKEGNFKNNDEDESEISNSEDLKNSTSVAESDENKVSEKDKKKNKKSKKRGKGKSSSKKVNKKKEKVAKEVNKVLKYEKSEKLVKNIKDKVVYDVTDPISGLPYFITQEMVVGALKCQDDTGYPASVTIAQIIQESGYGKYGGLSYLAFKHKNLFGIKGVGSIGGVVMNTGEQRKDGTRYRTDAMFRQYRNYTESIIDRVLVLNRGYKSLTKGVTDANTFAVNIGKRWATSLNYSSSLIKNMEKYDLYRLDNMTVSKYVEDGKNYKVKSSPCPGGKELSMFSFVASNNCKFSSMEWGTDGNRLAIYSIKSGKVTSIGKDKDGSNWVVIEDSEGGIYKYTNLGEIIVKKNSNVSEDQLIGFSKTMGDEDKTGVYKNIHILVTEFLSDESVISK